MGTGENKTGGLVEADTASVHIFPGYSLSDSIMVLRINESLERQRIENMQIDLGNVTLS